MVVVWFSHDFESFTLLSMYTAPTNASTASASAFNGGEIFNTATPPDNDVILTSLVSR